MSDYFDLLLRRRLALPRISLQSLRPHAISDNVKSVQSSAVQDFGEQSVFTLSPTSEYQLADRFVPSAFDDACSDDAIDYFATLLSRRSSAWPFPLRELAASQSSVVVSATKLGSSAEPALDTAGTADQYPPLSPDGSVSALDGTSLDICSPDDDAANIELIRASGLFLTDWYVSTYPDTAQSNEEPLIHFYFMGSQEGRRPNPYFDPIWYQNENPEVVGGSRMSLPHYINSGEQHGRRPIGHFDIMWYRSTYCKNGELPLLHFLQHRKSGLVSPIPDFDTEYYLQTYPDIAIAGIDPFEHYLDVGFKERRNPSAEFDTNFYVNRYFSGIPSENPLLHYINHRNEPGIYPCAPDHETNVFKEVRFFSQPGPSFEYKFTLPLSANRRAKVLAFYLPQFHRFNENDTWWGEGFTEWTNMARALPRFRGHYQPRIPRDLGFYNLEYAEAMREQIELAKGAGLFGFIFYFYWFNGKRLMERPLDTFLGDSSMDFPFALMWANENWTRRWDGLDQEVLIAQNYRPEDDAKLVTTFARHFRDHRYIRIDGRPLLMLYRPGIIPDCAKTIERLRRLFRTECGEDPIWVMAQGFGDTDPLPFGLDGAVEFPPHKVAVDLPHQNADLEHFDPDFSAPVVNYDAVVEASLRDLPANYPLIKGAFPSWDNDPRRQGAGMVFHGSTPAKYQQWLEQLILYAEKHPFHGERLVCINAWNEWAEGAYLEPDVHFGAAYLNATARAIAGVLRGVEMAKILLVGHDAHLHGAQFLLLNIGRQLRQRHGLEIEVLLLDGGQLVRQYGEVAPTHVIQDRRVLRTKVLEVYDRGFRTAIVNTSAAASICPLLKEVGMASTLLVHELPQIIREKKLLPVVQRAAQAVDRLIFAAPFVRDRFLDLVEMETDKSVILAQGSYKTVSFVPAARQELRDRLGVANDAALVLGVGYADLRKGFDLFLQIWRIARQAGAPMHFVWVGRIDPALENYLGLEIEAAVSTGTFHCAGYTDRPEEYYSAADVFLLTSREDPFPTVVLEALFAGTPTVAFEGAGGIPDMLRLHDVGVVVPLSDVQAMFDAVIDLTARTSTDDTSRRRGLQAIAERHFRFADYIAALFSQVCPGWLRVSVVIPSYNYSSYMRSRLTTIFQQSYPVLEIIVLDDASSDASVAIAREIAAEWNREVRIVVNEKNSGSVFRQWRKAAEVAKGDYVWIAEADDESEPHFVERLAEKITTIPDVRLAFSDSRAIDQDGRVLSESYKFYYAETEPACLAKDETFPMREFGRRLLSERNLILNVSAVIWNRETLLAAMRRSEEALPTYRMAGDWHLYIDVMASSDGKVAYVAEPLNVHRRHATSVTHKMSADAHLREIERVHTLARQRLFLDPVDELRQDSYLRKVEMQLGLIPVEVPSVDHQPSEVV